MLNWITGFINPRCWKLWFLITVFVVFTSACNIFSGQPAPAWTPGSVEATLPGAVETEVVNPALMVTPAGASTAMSAPSATPSLAPPPDFAPISVQASDCSYGGAFQAIEALDAYTVRFRLCRPDVAFLSKIAFPSLAIYPLEWLDQAGQPGFSLDAPVGSGPYRLQEWLKGEQITFQAVKDAPQDTSLIRELVFRWNLDASQRLVDLQAGAVDGIDNVGVEDFATVRADPDQRLLLRPPLSTLYLGMNAAGAFFQEEKVRQAIGLGIDRQALASQAFPEGYQVAPALTPCVIPDGCAGPAWPGIDPEKARLLLAESGLQGGFSTNLAYIEVVRGYLPQPGIVAQAIKNQLKEHLGVVVRLRPMESADFYKQLDAGKLDGMYLLGWGADYPDADNFFSAHFGIDAPLQFGSPFPDLQQAAITAAALIDARAREAGYIEANRLLQQQVPLVPLVHGAWISPYTMAVAYHQDIQGAYASPVGIETFTDMILPVGKERFVWMQQAEPLTLYCGAAEDVESLRACAQVAVGLYRYRPGEATAVPDLASSCVSDSALQVWTCKIDPGQVFHDGSLIDANDVVASFAVQWQAEAVLRLPEGGEFVFFQSFWPGVYR